MDEAAGQGKPIGYTRYDSEESSGGSVGMKQEAWALLVGLRVAADIYEGQNPNRLV